MIPKIVFKAEANLEFLDAIAWYESERSGLGKEFSDEFFHVIERAAIQPEIFRVVRGRARRVRLKRFKAYAVYFAVKDDAFSVLAVFHGSRNPVELKRRLQ